jgi:hypothetical protein
MNPNRPARLNRVVLALLGLVALAAGVFAVLRGTGVLATVLPVPADEPVLAAELTPPAWVPWVAAAVAIVVGLLALRWLIAQAIRSPGSSDWQLARDPHAGRTYIDSDVAAAPVAEEITEYPGVESATARLTGPRQRPRLYLRVSTDHRADISDLRHRIDDDAIPRLVQALDLPGLPADVLLRLDAGSGSRTR